MLVPSSKFRASRDVPNRKIRIGTFHEQNSIGKKIVLQDKKITPNCIFEKIRNNFQKKMNNIFFVIERIKY